jgi:hypothetical protein
MATYGVPVNGRFLQRWPATQNAEGEKSPNISWGLTKRTIYLARNWIETQVAVF